MGSQPEYFNIILYSNECFISFFIYFFVNQSIIMIKITLSTFCLKFTNSFHFKINRKSIFMIQLSWIWQKILFSEILPCNRKKIIHNIEGWERIAKYKNALHIESEKGASLLIYTLTFFALTPRYVAFLFHQIQTNWIDIFIFLRSFF